MRRQKNFTVKSFLSSETKAKLLIRDIFYTDKRTWCRLKWRWYKETCVWEYTGIIYTGGWEKKKERQHGGEAAFICQRGLSLSSHWQKPTPTICPLRCVKPLSGPRGRKRRREEDKIPGKQAHAHTHTHGWDKAVGKRRSPACGFINEQSAKFYPFLYTFCRQRFVWFICS